jgi:hypothetical protein
MASLPPLSIQNIHGDFTVFPGKNRARLLKFLKKFTGVTGIFKMHLTALSNISKKIA